MTGGDLTLTGLDDLTHQDRVDVLGIDARFREGVLDGETAKFLCAQGREGTREFANGGTTAATMTLRDIATPLRRPEGNHR